MPASIGRKFVAALMAAGKPADLIKYGDLTEQFTQTEVELYAFVREFAKQYGKLPDAMTIKAHTGEELAEFEEPPEYYRDLMLLRHIERVLKQRMKQAADLLGVTGKDAEQALQVLMQAVQELAIAKAGRQVTALQEAYDLIMPDYAAKWSSQEGGLLLGWPSFDEMTGGLYPGDMVSLVGKIARGKSWMLLYGAYHGWWQHGACQLFVSNEMPQLEVHQRLAALHAQVPAKKLFTASLTTPLLTKLKAGLTEIKSAKAPFWIVEGNFAAKVEDVWALARQLKPDGIWIDGGYLMEHPTEKDRYRRVAENAELNKKELSPLAPVVVSWQFAKSQGGSKKAKKTEKQDMEEIGYSLAIPQVSTVVLGLFEDDSVETIASRLVEVLKGRKGEIGSFRTRWDFVKMDFTELVKEDVSELQFV